MDANTSNTHFDDYSTTISQGNNYGGLTVGIQNGNIFVFNLPSDGGKPTTSDFRRFLKETVGEELSPEELNKITNECYSYVKNNSERVPLQDVLDHAQLLNGSLKKILTNTEDIRQKTAELYNLTKTTKKKQKKRTIVLSVLAGVLAVLLLVGGGIVLWQHFKSTGFEYEGFWVTVNKDGTATVSVKELQEDIIFPNYVEDEEGNRYRVTAIGKAVTSENDPVESVNLSTSIQRIEDSAFTNFSSLEKIVIPESVTYIGNAFQGCINLQNVNINDLQAWCKITFEGAYANPLIYAKSLTLSKEPISGEIALEEGIESVPAYTFYGAEITRLNLPESLQAIGQFAFSGCASLTDVTIPNSVTSIGEKAFMGCNRLEKITLPFVGNGYDETHFGYIFGASDSSENAKFVPVSLKEVVLAGGTLVAEEAFMNCTSLTSITIPETVTEIGHSAFSGCESLTEITIPNGMTSIGEKAFMGCSGLEKFSLPVVGNGSDATYFGYIFGASDSSENAEYVPASLKEVVLTGGTLVAEEAFMNCTSLTSITIPKTVTKIDGGYMSGAFMGCSSLTSVTFARDSQLTTIGWYAFYGCSSLSNISIPETVTKIGDDAFYNCSSLSNISIPASVTKIGDDAFLGTSIYNDVHNWDKQLVLYIDNCLIEAKETISGTYIIKPGTRLIVDEAFKSCYSLIKITIPASVTSIGSYAFSWCNSLENVMFEGDSQLSLIEDGAFYACNKITDIIIPKNVSSIGSFAFAGCQSLKNIEVDSANTTYHASRNCIIQTASKTLVIGCNESIIPQDGSVTSIASFAFAYCTFRSIEIPTSVTSIGYGAFEDCISLTSIVIPASVTKVGSHAFYACSSLTIYCETAEKPGGWDEDWNPNGRPVIWGYKGQS